MAHTVAFILAILASMVFGTSTVVLKLFFWALNTLDHLFNPRTRELDRRYKRIRAEALRTVNEHDTGRK